MEKVNEIKRVDEKEVYTRYTDGNGKIPTGTDYESSIGAFTDKKRREVFGPKTRQASWPLNKQGASKGDEAAFWQWLSG